MSPVNGATDALSIGPSAGYTLFFIFVHILLLFTSYISSDTHMHMHIVTYITLVLTGDMTNTNRVFGLRNELVHHLFTPHYFCLVCEMECVDPSSTHSS
jgi:hypothetical protein